MSTAYKVKEDGENIQIVRSKDDKVMANVIDGELLTTAAAYNRASILDELKKTHEDLAADRGVALGAAFVLSRLQGDPTGRAGGRGTGGTHGKASQVLQHAGGAGQIACLAGGKVSGPPFRGVDRLRIAFRDPRARWRDSGRKRRGSLLDPRRRAGPGHA